MTDAPTAAHEWSAVASAWDHAVDDIDVHSEPATRALRDALRVQPGDRVLELAAGPGSLAGTWSALVGGSGHVVVSDAAPGMVEVARRRNDGLGNVEFAVIDASAIDRPDGAFDVVASRMGLMFTPEPEVAFAEIHRVLRPGGRFGALTWAGPEDNPWMTCVGMAAMVNGLVAGGPPTGPGGVFSLSDLARLSSLATGAGFTDVTVGAVAVVFDADSIEQHIERVSSLAGPLAAAFAAASPDQLEAVHRTAAELAAGHLRDGRLVLPGTALLVAGTRPLAPAS